MPVDSKHPSYSALHQLTLSVRDCIEGEFAVKSRGETYLPYPSDFDRLRHENKHAIATIMYNTYKSRAELSSLVTEALFKMSGLVANSTCIVELPPRMEYLRDQATGDGLTLHNFYIQVVREVLTAGRYGVLTDPDETGKVLLYGYKSESITNWSLNDDMLNLAVLKESYLSGGDEFAPEYKEQYRVLRLVDGVYQSQVYRDGSEQVDKTAMLTTAKNNGLAFIPLQPIRAVVNGWQIDNPIPLHPVSKNVLKAYQLSADYYHYLYNLSKVMLVTQGIDTNKDDSKPRGFSSTQAVHLPANAQATLLQANPSGIAAIKQAMDDKLIEARSLAMQLQATSGVEAAEAVRLKHESQQITLRGVAVNAAQGIENALKTAAEIMGENPNEVVFRAPESLIDQSLDIAELTGLGDLVLNNLMPKSVLWARMRQGKLTEMTDEELQKALDNQVVNGL